MGKGSWKRGDFQGGAQKWQQNYGSAGANLKKGAAAPRRDPTQAAIGQQAALLQGFNEAVSSGRWAAGLQKAGQAGWQSGMNRFADTGMAAAASKGAPRVAAFAQSYGPAAMSQVASLPQRGAKGTNQQRSAQMNDWQHSQRGRYRNAWRGGTA